MQIASQIFPFFEIPNWAVRLVVLLLIIGFPVALILASGVRTNAGGNQAECEELLRRAEAAQRFTRLRLNEQFG